MAACSRTRAVLLRVMLTVTTTQPVVRCTKSNTIYLPVVRGDWVPPASARARAGQGARPGAAPRVGPKCFVIIMAAASRNRHLDLWDGTGPQYDCRFLGRTAASGACSGRAAFNGRFQTQAVMTLEKRRHQTQVADENETPNKIPVLTEEEQREIWRAQSNMMLQTADLSGTKDDDIVTRLSKKLKSDSLAAIEVILAFLHYILAVHLSQIIL